MSVPQPLLEAGLSVEYQEDGARLIVRDADPGACAIRSRGGEAVARLLKENPVIRALDVRESNITDNGVGQISLALRLTNQLEELSLGVVGHAGLQWILGVVQRCSRLRSLRFEVCDVATLHAGRQTIEVSDFDTSRYVPPPPGEDEEEEEAEEGEEEEAEEEAEEDEGEDEEEAARKKAAKLAAKVRAKFADNRADSGDEGELARARGPSSAEPAGASQKLLRLLSDFVACARASQGLRSVECVGEAIPAELMLDLDRALQEHRDAAEKKGSESEEGANTNMHACLGGKKEALLSDLLQIAAWAQRAPAEEEVEDASVSLENRKINTRLGLRHYLGETLVAPLGEALFECQRFKSKDNEAVATANGEIAFVAMALRKHAQMASQRGMGRVP